MNRSLVRTELDEQSYAYDKIRYVKVRAYDLKK